MQRRYHDSFDASTACRWVTARATISPRSPASVLAFREFCCWWAAFYSPRPDHTPPLDSRSTPVGRVQSPQALASLHCGGAGGIGARAGWHILGWPAGGRCDPGARYRSPLLYEEGDRHGTPHRPFWSGLASGRNRDLDRSEQDRETTRADDRTLEEDRAGPARLIVGLCLWLVTDRLAAALVVIPGLIAATSLSPTVSGTDPLRHARDTPGACGYILRGISEPRCPECGERV